MPQRKTRKLSVRAYFPVAMSTSKFFNVSSSRPTLAGVPFGQFFVGQVTAEVGGAACPAASKLAAVNRNKETTRMTRPSVFFTISAPERTRAGPGRNLKQAGRIPGIIRGQRVNKDR